MHYDKFISIAKLCDIIFTTDSNCIEKYKRDVPKAEIDVLPFAANINICNPINRFRIEPNTICFAGSYYAERHENRKKQMDIILPTIIKYNGTIYDRMSNSDENCYKFPEKYKNYIHQSVNFDEIVKIYKRYLLFINVNTITNSPTMMSRRVYELLACGTPVLSTPSEAIDKQFNGIVQTARTTDEAISIAGSIINDSKKWRRLSHIGYREVMTKHTYTHRSYKILKYLNISIPNTLNKVSLIIPTKRPQYIDRIIENISRQDYLNKEAILIIQNFTSDQERYLNSKLKNIFVNNENFTIIRDDSTHTLGERLNIGIKRSKGDIIAKMDDDDFYFDKYISDIVLTFNFPSVDIVGKKEIFIYLEKYDTTVLRFKGECHKFTNFISGPTVTARRNVFSNISFHAVNNGEDTNFLKDAISYGYNIYSSDPYNFIQYRSANVSSHTWRVDADYFYNNAQIIGKGLCKEACVF